MALDPTRARAQLQLVLDAKTREERAAIAGDLINFLLRQREELVDLAAGWMRPGGAETIAGTTWCGGKELAEIADQLTHAVAADDLRDHEEFASRLAIGFALPVMGHYPNEIFPRMNRNAVAKEKRGQNDDARHNYQCVLDDFVTIETPEIWDYDPLDERSRIVLEAALVAAEGILRLNPRAEASVEELRGAIRKKLEAHPREEERADA